MTVTLYGIPGACSMSCHIGLIMAGIPHKFSKLDKATMKTDDGEDYHSINPVGAVPALKLESGEIITQNQAILWWIGQTSKKVCYSDSVMGQVKLIEGLGQCSDLHGALGAFIFQKTGEGNWTRRMKELEARLPSSGWILGGSEPTAIDIYTAVVLNWNNFGKVSFAEYPKAHTLFQKVFALPATQQALKDEGLA